MSLLIKALDQAAKNKEAEQGQAVPTAIPTPLNLTLEPRAEKSAPTQPSSSHADVGTQDLNINASYFNQALASDSVAANFAQQSLEEEAGLTLPTKKPVPSKYAKNAMALANTALPNAAGIAHTLNAADNTALLDEVQNPAAMETNPFVTMPPVFQSMAQEQQKQEQQKQNQHTAAKVFVANEQSEKAHSKLSLFLLAFAGALIILLMWQGYQMLRAYVAPEPVVVNLDRSVAPTTESLADVNAALIQNQSLTGLPADNIGDQLSAANTESLVPVPDMQIVDTQLIDAQLEAPPQRKSVEMPAEATPAKPSAIEQAMNSIRAELRTENARYAEVELKTSDMKTNAVTRKASQQTQSSNLNPSNSNSSNLNSSTVQLLKKSPADGVDPHLQAAYQAFTVGNFSLAQQQYRTVLQADIRNVDALLGMAAIAQRQNRVADANGWYQKVLEIDPRNNLALTAMANMAVNNDAVATESRLKSMIAEQPNNANLHATLGNVLAEKNQWSSAQEAYFNASKLAPDNADYAFNLAVSLEQLRKPKLAYAQYLRALDLLNANNANSPVRAVLEARIKLLSAQ